MKAIGRFTCYPLVVFFAAAACNGFINVTGTEALKSTFFVGGIFAASVMREIDWYFES